MLLYFDSRRFGFRSCLLHFSPSCLSGSPDLQGQLRAGRASRVGARSRRPLHHRPDARRVHGDRRCEAAVARDVLVRRSAGVGWIPDRQQQQHASEPRARRRVGGRVCDSTRIRRTRSSSLTFNEAVQEAWRPTIVAEMNPAAFASAMSSAIVGARHDGDLRRDHVGPVAPRARQAHAAGADRGQRRRRQRQQGDARRHAEARARFRRHRSTPSRSSIR